MAKNPSAFPIMDAHAPDAEMDMHRQVLLRWSEREAAVREPSIGIERTTQNGALRVGVITPSSLVYTPREAKIALP